MSELKKQDNEKKKDYQKLARVKTLIFFALAIIILAGIFLNQRRPFSSPGKEASHTTAELGTLNVTEDGEYSDRDHVALYIHTYGRLPANYITKTKAKEAGWVAEKGNLREVLPGKSIGGGIFQNEEGKLPEKEGRIWKECDIGYDGGERNGKRIVFSNDGLIYYTEDHYNTFEQLYGEKQ